MEESNKLVQGNYLGTLDPLPIWKENLTGHGEIIGMADTGIDHDMCFFGDSVAVPFCKTVAGTGVHSKPTLNQLIMTGIL